MELSDLPIDDLLNICRKLDTPELENFMKTSSKVYNICYHEWNIRHRKVYPLKHRFLTREQRDQLKQCIKDYQLKNTNMFDEVQATIASENNLTKLPVSSELKNLVELSFREDYKGLIAVLAKYGGTLEDVGRLYQTNPNYNRDVEEMVFENLSRLLDRLHSDESLLQLRDIIVEFATGEKWNIPPCLILKY